MWNKVIAAQVCHDYSGNKHEITPVRLDPFMVSLLFRARRERKRVWLYVSLWEIILSCMAYGEVRLTECSIIACI